MEEIWITSWRQFRHVERDKKESGGFYHLNLQARFLKHRQDVDELIMD